MKKSVILLLLALSGCAHYADYQPKLASTPKDNARYETDRKFCLSESLKRKNNSALFSDDDFKTPRQMTDECMASKGYNVVKVSHCC